MKAAEEAEAAAWAVVRLESETGRLGDHSRAQGGVSGTKDSLPFLLKKISGC